MCNFKGKLSKALEGLVGTWPKYLNRTVLLAPSTTSDNGNTTVNILMLNELS